MLEQCFQRVVDSSFLTLDLQDEVLDDSSLVLVSQYNIGNCSTMAAFGVSLLVVEDFLRFLFIISVFFTKDDEL